MLNCSTRIEALFPLMFVLSTYELASLYSAWYVHVSYIAGDIHLEGLSGYAVIPCLVMLKECDPQCYF